MVATGSSLSDTKARTFAACFPVHRGGDLAPPVAVRQHQVVDLHVLDCDESTGRQNWNVLREAGESACEYVGGFDCRPVDSGDVAVVGCVGPVVGKDLRGLRRRG